MAKKQKKQRLPASGDVATNRRARHKFEFVETMEAGMVLRGSEVKALRGGKAQMTDAYAIVDKGEVWLRNLHIPPYEFAGNDNHEPARAGYDDNDDVLIALASHRASSTALPSKSLLK